MSKAEERARDLGYGTDPLNRAEYTANEVRDAFIEGYHQAEKDLELTCDDIEIIVNTFLDIKIESVKSRETKKYTDEEYCVEILKRFKERKEK